MSLTLEVSKLSGWLKAFAFCRIGRRHTTKVNVRVDRMVWNWSDCRIGRVAACYCVQRTVNIQCISVTCDVWKFTGWLNA